MSMFRAFRAIAASVLVSLAACSSGYSTSPDVPPAVDAVAVGPVALVLKVGQTQQLVAHVTDAGGRKLTDRVVSWRSDSPDVAVVSDSGLVKATGLGYVTIIASCEGKTFGVAATVVPE
ncbi:MAG TPA: Ig-like domain-containing protein [Gemmatimonadaceae bacterium]|jgi:uncharacterized protein YjdB